MKSHHLVLFVLEKNNFTIEKHFIISMINCFFSVMDVLEMLNKNVTKTVFEE